MSLVLVQALTRRRDSRKKWALICTSLMQMNQSWSNFHFLLIWNNDELVRSLFLFAYFGYPILVYCEVWPPLMLWSSILTWLFQFLRLLVLAIRYDINKYLFMCFKAVSVFSDRCLAATDVDCCILDAATWTTFEESTFGWKSSMALLFVLN